MKRNGFNSLDSTQRFMLFAIVVLPILAWFGPLERVSYEYTNETLTNAGLIYATARGINALVSVVQTTEVSSGLAAVIKADMSVQIGQVLDPLNDLIERFSAILLVALGSIALQKILLVLVSDKLFNIAISAIALCTLGGLLSEDKKYYRFFAKAFWVTAFLRFSLVLVVFANSWVDSAFLAESEERQHQSMEELRGELETIREAVTLDDESLEEMERLNLLIPNLTDSIKIKENDLIEFEKELERSRAELKELRKESLKCRVLITEYSCSEQVLQLKTIVDKQEEDKGIIENDIDRLTDELSQAEESMECFEKRSNGQSCSWTESVGNVVSIKQNLARLQARVTDFTEATISLLMSLLLKTVLIPLLFLWALVKVVGIPWSNISQHIEPNPEKRKKRIQKSQATGSQVHAESQTA